MKFWETLMLDIRDLAEKTSRVNFLNSGSVLLGFSPHRSSLQIIFVTSFCEGPHADTPKACVFGLPWSFACVCGMGGASELPPPCLNAGWLQFLRSLTQASLPGGGEAASGHSWTQARPRRLSSVGWVPAFRGQSTTGGSPPVHP